MPKYKFNVAMDIRAYGSIEGEGDTPEAARAALTAEIAADTFQPNGSGSDDLDYKHPSDIWINGEYTSEDDEEHGELDDRQIPDGDWITKPEAATVLNKADLGNLVMLVGEAAAENRTQSPQFDEMWTRLAQKLEAMKATAPPPERKAA